MTAASNTLRRMASYLLPLMSTAAVVLGSPDAKMQTASDVQPTGPLFFRQSIETGGRRAPGHVQYGSRQALARLLRSLPDSDVPRVQLLEVDAAHSTLSTDSDASTWWSVSAWVFQYRLGGSALHALVTSDGTITTQSADVPKRDVIVLDDWVIDFEDAHREVRSRGFVSAPRDFTGKIGAGARLYVDAAKSFGKHPSWEGPWDRLNRPVYVDATSGAVDPTFASGRGDNTTQSAWTGGYETGSLDELRARRGEDYPPISYTRRPNSKDPWRDWYVFNRSFLISQKARNVSTQLAAKELALIEAALGNWYEACRAADRAAAETPNDPDVRRLRALLFIGIPDLGAARRELSAAGKQGVDVSSELKLLDGLRRNSRIGTLSYMVPFTTSFGMIPLRLQFAPVLLDDPLKQPGK